MNKAKRGVRALRHKNKSDSPENSDSEPEMTQNTQKSTALKDFRLQAQIHIDHLDEAHNRSAQAMRLHYRKLLLAIDPDILELTVEQFLKLKNAYEREQQNDESDTEMQTINEENSPSPAVKTTQSPNITSTLRATRSSGKKSVEAKTPAPPSPEPEPEIEEEKDSEHEENSDPVTPQRKESEIVVYKRSTSLSAAPFPNIISNNSGSIFTGMPLLNLFIPVKDGTAVTVLGRPVNRGVGALPEISPSVMRDLEVMQKNISILTKAWKEQLNRKKSNNKKSITAGKSH